MAENSASEGVCAGARDALPRLAGLAEAQDLAAAQQLVWELRDIRDYDLMGSLAEAVSRYDPNDARNHRLYAQCLIDSGQAHRGNCRPVMRCGLRHLAG